MKSQEHIFPNFYPFHCWHNPHVQDIGDSVLEFLQRCNGPTHLFIPGEDSSRSRVVVTLLHGNEPSGLYAIHQLLKEKIKPKVDIHCFIPSVAAAKAPPVFHYRMLPGQKDLNRCFKKIDLVDTTQEKTTEESAADGHQQKALAKGIVHTIAHIKPEAVLDIHNTSGSGPSFGVTTFLDSRHDALVSLFTQRLIVTDLSLGALMEISEHLVPTVTIECGGAQDMESNLIARDGLEKYFLQDSVLEPKPTDFDLELFTNPMRLELTRKATLIYSDIPQPDVDIALTPTIDHFNFGVVDENTELGFLNHSLADTLVAQDAEGVDHAQAFFQTVNGVLRPTQKLKLFMATTNPEIAKRDCLFYFVRA